MYKQRAVNTLKKKQQQQNKQFANESKFTLNLMSNLERRDERGIPGKLRKEKKKKKQILCLGNFKKIVSGVSK